MSGRIIRAIVCAALLAAAGGTRAVASGDDAYTVYIDYNGDGTTMNASWSSRADEDGSAILCFAEGAASVSICGNEPCKVKGGTWPCWGEERYRYEPDFGAVLTLNVASSRGEEIEIAGGIHRMVRTDDGLYRMERDRFNRVETLGDLWKLDLGSDADGTSYVLNVRIEGRGEESRTRIKDDMVVTVRYIFRDTRTGSDDEQVSRRGRLLLESGDDATNRAEFEVPVQVRGVDSSVLFTQVTLKNPSEGRDHGRRTLDAIFAMDRQLAMGVQPAGNTGMTTIDGHMMMSSFQRAITLYPGRTLRIEIPEQDSEREFIRTEEYIELEWDEGDGH